MYGRYKKSKESLDNTWSCGGGAAPPQIGYRGGQSSQLQSMFGGKSQSLTQQISDIVTTVGPG